MVYLAVGKDLLPMCDFVSLCIGHLKNTGLLSDPNLSNGNISLYNIKNSHLLISPLIRKIIKVLGSCETHGGEYKFSKILIFSFKLRFYHWQQILSVVVLEVTGSLCSFERKCLPNEYPCLHSHSLSAIV